ncbi:hypothetical protein [Herbidospora mongoliensis]|uniref:hypothetical protein n=1 Tax=Herbidospora mongoliensis TaxID=688067 RepID=UPI000836CCDA|nr:hypothetical protein [Herbidospora mongoliensis]
MFALLLVLTTIPLFSSPAYADLWAGCDNASGSMTGAQTNLNSCFYLDTDDIDFDDIEFHHPSWIKDTLKDGRRAEVWIAEQNQTNDMIGESACGAGCSVRLDGIVLSWLDTYSDHPIYQQYLLCTSDAYANPACSSYRRLYPSW